MKILFMGTPDFAQASLKALYDAKYDMIGVVTKHDKPKGKGMKLVASPVKEFAMEKGLKIYQPTKIKNNEELKFKFDIGIIELLGSQLYIQLPSIIVEFISNAYDADATEVEVIIDEDD